MNLFLILIKGVDFEIYGQIGGRFATLIARSKNQWKCIYHAPIINVVDVSI